MTDLGLLLLTGIGSAIAFGAGDFSGGLASKRDPVVRVVALAHLLSLALYLALALGTGEGLPRAADLAWGALAGLAGAIGLVALYRGLALGPMGTVAAVTAVLATAVPVTFGLLLGGRLSPTQFAGTGLALAGVVLLSRQPTGGRGGLGHAVVAGLGFGAFFVFLGQTEPGAVFWPLVMARLASSACMLALALRGPGLRPRRGGLIALSSVLDATGNLLFLLAAQSGHLAEASVLSNVAPAFTAVLAATILRERLRKSQAWGLAATVLAIPLISGNP